MLEVVLFSDEVAGLDVEVDVLFDGFSQKGEFLVERGG